MARDLNRLMEDIRRSREVFVTEDGEVEERGEAEDKAAQEEQLQGEPKRRTRLKPEVFGSTDTVRVLDLVILAMHAEAHRHRGETGGIIVGPEPRFVTELISSGMEAHRTTASYGLDVSHLQPLLEDAEDRGLQFLGVWHSHPEGARQLSSQDRAVARRILTDPDWASPELLLPLSVRSRDHFETDFFLTEGDEPYVRRLRPVLVSSSRQGPGRVRAPSAQPARSPAWNKTAAESTTNIRFCNPGELNITGCHEILHHTVPGFVTLVVLPAPDRIRADRQEDMMIRDLRDSRALMDLERDEDGPAPLMADEWAEGLVPCSGGTVLPSRSPRRCSCRSPLSLRGLPPRGRCRG